MELILYYNKMRLKRNVLHAAIESQQYMHLTRQKETALILSIRTRSYVGSGGVGLEPTVFGL